MPGRPIVRRFSALLFAITLTSLAAGRVASASETCPGTHNDAEGIAVVLPASPPEACLQADAFKADPDVARNLAALAGPNICLKHDDFDEAGTSWHLLIAQSRSHPDSVFWMVPHNNEHSGFDTALFGLQTYGGTMVAVRTGGKRCDGAVDPNRNFDDGKGLNCRNHPARSPVYTSHVLRFRTADAPIIALHTNEKGFDGDHAGGSGNISIHLQSAGLHPFPGDAPAVGQSPDDTLVYVSSPSAPGADPKAQAVKDSLNRSHVNVQYETVSTQSNDCSLSNYSVLHHFPVFHNLEAVHGDTAGQTALLQRLATILALKVVAP